jgi:hypothetical protein
VQAVWEGGRGTAGVSSACGLWGSGSRAEADSDCARPQRFQHRHPRWNQSPKATSKGDPSTYDDRAIHISGHVGPHASSYIDPRVSVPEGNSYTSNTHIDIDHRKPAASCATLFSASVYVQID